MIFKVLSTYKRYTYMVVMLGIFCLLLGALYAFLLYFIGLKAESVSLLVREVKSETALELELKELETLISNTETSREKLGEHFLSPNDIVSFIEKVESLARKADIAFDFEAVTIKGEGRDAVLSLSFITEGLFDDSLYFFELFELLPYAFVFEKALFSSRSGSSWNGTFDVTLTSFLGENL